MNYRTRIILFLLLNLTHTTDLFSQPLPDSITKKIDGFFKKWDNNKSPGCVIGIVRNDSLIYSRGYGMANLEFDIPITTETIFHMASVSKQFTGFSIVLLAKQGKLQLDDDIRKYLSWFPDLKEKITIRNLLNHTSGIRDQWQLLSIAGIRPDDVITQDLLIKVLSKQTALNFKPGKEFGYSNSNFTLLAEIVKSVSGQSLRKFTDSAIFKPLGMHQTHFRDDYTGIEKNRSSSYHRIGDSHFVNSIFSNSAIGATNLYTNVYDMTKWISNFYNPRKTELADIALLTQKGKLNNGEELQYASGIYSDTYKGWKRYSHAGGDAGYRSFMAVFPDLKMGFFVFTNISDVPTFSKAHQMADLFITDISDKPVNSPKKIDSSRAVLADTQRIKKYLGSYIDEDGQRMLFTTREKNLFLNSAYFGGSLLLAQENDSIFSILDGSDIKFSFSTTQKKEPLLYIIFPGDEKFLFKKYRQDIIFTDDLLTTYTGTYYCPELEYSYNLIVKDHQLYIESLKYDQSNILLTGGPDHLYTNLAWMNHLLIIRNNKKEITGFEVNSGRVKHLRFNKIK